MILRWFALLLSVLTTILAASGCAVTRDASAGPNTLITNALIVDGSGTPGYRGSLRIRDGRIAEMGSLNPSHDDHVIDAKGLVLAPGFIDTHNHHIDTVERASKPYLTDRPEALAAVSQGITTSLVGQDGRSILPLEQGFKELAAKGVAINVASFVGHGSVRESVMGLDFRRKANPTEIQAMKLLVRQSMLDGALGLSTGLEYNPGIYSTREEVIELAREAALHGGRYISHLRSEDRGLWAALDEIINVGRLTGMPVQVSHMKLGMMDLWGQADRYLAKLNAARNDGVDITGDVYPYDFWQTSLSLLFPDRDYGNKTAAQYALDHVVRADGIRLTLYRPNPAYVGRTLAEIARERKEDEATTLMNLIVDAPVPDNFEYATMKGMSQADVDHLFLWEHANLCSDGFLIDGHPRGAGAFTRALRYYVREKKLLSLEAVVRKMSALAALHMGIEQRGTLTPGFHADLVLFDPDTVTDRATPGDPTAISEGISRVWVNGSLVFNEGKPTGALPGLILRRKRVEGYSPPAH